MDRRVFLGGTGALVLPLVGCPAWTRRNDSLETPNAHQLATLRAIAATFIPPTNDSPGADEVDAVKTILDPAYSVNPYVSEVVSDLDDWCVLRHSARRFVDLTPAKRERALEERMGLRGRIIQSWYRPVYLGILSLTKLAYFGGLSHLVGMNYVGFPGASTGYAARSAAGAYHTGTRTITVEGPGRVSALRVTARVSAPHTDATAQLRGPNQHAHQVLTAAAPLALDDVAVATAIGLPAAGPWTLELTGLAYWSFTLRTDLDDEAR